MKAMVTLVDKTSKGAVDVSLVTKAIVHALTANKPKAYYNIGSHAKLPSIQLAAKDSGHLHFL